VHRTSDGRNSGTDGKYPNCFRPNIGLRRPEPAPGMCNTAPAEVLLKFRRSGTSCLSPGFFPGFCVSTIQQSRCLRPWRPCEFLLSQVRDPLAVDRSELPSRNSGSDQPRIRRRLCPGHLNGASTRDRQGWRFEYKKAAPRCECWGTDRFPSGSTRLPSGMRCVPGR
jgi:hypothetical protein